MNDLLNPEQKVAELLKQSGKTLALAESCTGGLVSERITDIPGISESYKGGVVAYSNDIKSSVLHVPGDIIDRCGAVSSEVASCMSKGARETFGADITASITGVAGPGGGSPEKPVGLAFIAVTDAEGTHVREIRAGSERQQNRSRLSKELLKLLFARLENAATRSS